MDCSGAGILRRRRGRGFEYLDERGERIDDAEVLERIRELVIPPFDYVAKGGKRHIQSLVDRDVHRVVETLKRRRSGRELLAYRNGRTWFDVRSDDINAYIKEVTRDGYSAKDFRTWNATVIAAVGLRCLR